MSQLLETLQAQTKSANRRIIFPESTDPRVMHAALEFTKNGFGSALFIKKPAVQIQDVEVFDQIADKDQWFERCVEAYLNMHSGKDIDSCLVEIELRNNLLLFAAMLVHTGYADGGIAGSIATTADVIRAGICGIGLDEGKKLLSSLFLMELGNQVMTYQEAGDSGIDGAERGYID